MAKQVRCDYCGGALPGDVGGLVDRDCWRLADGIRACDACLVANADDFASLPSTERTLALRVRHGHYGIDYTRMCELLTGDVVDRDGNDLVARARADLRRAVRLYSAGERLVAIELVAAVWHQAVHFADANRKQPRLLRDAARQAGTRQPRASRMPMLDHWLDDNLPATADDLWRELGLCGYDSDLYRDGDNVIEHNPRNGVERGIGRSGFNKRFTKARARLKKRRE